MATIKDDAGMRVDAKCYFDFAESQANANRKLSTYDYAKSNLNHLLTELSIIKDKNIQGSYIVDDKTMLEGKYLTGEPFSTSFKQLYDFVASKVREKRTDFALQVSGLTMTGTENPFYHPIAKALGVDAVTSTFLINNEVLSKSMYESIVAGTAIEDVDGLGFWNTNLEKATKNIANFKKVRKLVYRNGKTFLVTYYVNPVDQSHNEDSAVELADHQSVHDLAMKGLMPGDWVDMGSGQLARVRRFEPNGAIRLEMPDGSKKNMDFKKFAQQIGNGTWKLASQATVTAQSTVSATSKPKTTTFPTKVSDLTHVKFLGGSTGADLYTDANGKEWVLKKGGNLGQTRSEALANQLYNIMGYNAPASTILTENGQDYMVSEFIGNVENINNNWDAGTLKDIKYAVESSFVAHALLGNWDVVENDNTKYDAVNKRIYFIDNGGSLLYRAQGTLKSKAQFDKMITELTTMRSSANSAKQKYWFGDLSNGDIVQQIENFILPKKKEILDAIAKADLNGTQAKDVAKVMKERFDFLEEFVKKQPVVNVPVKCDTAKDTLQSLTAKNTAANNYLDVDVVTLAQKIDTDIKANGGGSVSAEKGFIDFNHFVHARGFNNRPVVLRHADFEAIWKKEQPKGATLNYRTVGAGHEDSFKDRLEMYVGGVGQSYYGAGVYFAQEDNQKTLSSGTVPPPPHTGAFDDSRNYGDITHYAMIPHDFKWADGDQMADEVYKFLNNTVPNPAYTKVQQEFTQTQTALNTFVKNYSKNLAKKLNYSETVGNYLTSKHQVRDWSEAHVHELAAHLTKFGNGAGSTKVGNSIRLQLPNNPDGSQGAHFIYTFTGQGNTGGKNYNQQVKGLFNQVYDAYVGPFMQQTQNYTSDKAYQNLAQKMSGKQLELNNTPATIAAGTANASQDEIEFRKLLKNHAANKKIGLWAIWKGYDGLKDTNGRYRVVYNRSKVVVSDKNYM